MALDSPPVPGETGPVEPPTQFAELVVQFGPVQPLGSVRGRVPPEQAPHLITTFGIVAIVITGIVGAVLTLRIAPGLTGPAYAELGLAFGSVALLAMRRARTRATMRRKPSETRARGPGSGPGQ